MKLDVEYFLDKIIEYNENVYDYTKSSRQYVKKHGHGVYLDASSKFKPEERHIEATYRWQNENQSEVMAMFELLGLDRDERHRAYKAARTLQRWYKRTQYERCITWEMREAFERYIFE